MIAASIMRQSAFPAGGKQISLPATDCTGNTEKHTRRTPVQLRDGAHFKDILVNQSPTFISNIRFVPFTLRGTPRPSRSFLACIKLLPTVGNSNRLQGFIRQTLINLIIDRISTRTREIKRRFCCTLLYYLRRFLGTFAVTQCLDIIRGITLYEGPDITSPPQSRAPLVKAICHVSNIKYCLRANIAVRIFLYANLLYGSVLRTTNGTSPRIHMNCIPI